MVATPHKLPEGTVEWLPLQGDELIACKIPVVRAGGFYQKGIIVGLTEDKTSITSLHVTIK